MSEIDPWALPQGGVSDAGAGIPGVAPQPRMVLAAPLNKTLPIIVMVLGVLYVAVSLIEVFVVNNEVSLLNSVIGANSVTQDQLNQAQNDDNTINSVATIALLVFVGTLVSIFVWQRSLNRTLGSVGARRAVFSRAGYVYFRGAWAVSFLISILLTTTNNDNQTTIQDAVNHDHELMLYYGARALVGVVLLFFAFRLKKISEEGVARMGGAYL
jgi:hypothetical protein